MSKKCHLVVVGFDEIVLNKYLELVDEAIRKWVLDGYSIVDLVKERAEVEKHLKTFMETDRKTNLQEYAASHGAKEQYEIIGEEGPDHDKKYIYRVTLDGKTAEGKGKTKQDAEQAAAKEYYEKYIENGEKKC